MSTGVLLAGQSSAFRCPTPNFPSKSGQLPAATQQRSLPATPGWTTKAGIMVLAH